jgi:FdhD protein
MDAWRSHAIEARMSTRRVSIHRVEHDSLERAIDTAAVEEPLEIRLAYRFKEAVHCESMAVTMRTPGHDKELAAGFLLSEGLIACSRDIIDVRSLGPEPSNEIIAELAPHVDIERWRLSRATFVSSSCGVCGKRSRDAIPALIPVSADLCLSSSLIYSLPELLRSRQAAFAETGCLHAAALVDTEGNIEAAFEDVGRHNALDKLTGDALLQQRLPLSGKILFLSSRGSFELVQKAAAARAPVLATVGGPSSLAIEAARDCGMTLIGFVKPGRFNIYSGEWRVHLDR